MVRMMCALVWRLMRSPTGGCGRRGAAKKNKLVAIGLAAFTPARAQPTGVNQFVAGPFGELRDGT